MCDDELIAHVTDLASHYRAEVARLAEELEQRRTQGWRQGIKELAQQHRSKGWQYVASEQQLLRWRNARELPHLSMAQTASGGWRQLVKELALQRSLSSRRAEPGIANASKPSCAARLAVEEALYHRWRRHAGALACDLRGTGPSGGFCLHGGQRKSGGNHMMAQALAEVLSQLFANATVLDVGAGLGQYGSHFAAHAPSVRWFGVDGAENIEWATGGRVRFVDIADGLPAPLRREYDWVMSIEAAEHVPRANEAALMHTLVAHAHRGVVLSWAGLGHQAGLNHANCQSREYVACAMMGLGMLPDRDLTLSLSAAALRGKSPLPWLRGALAVYRPASESALAAAATGLGTPAELAALRRHLAFPLPTSQFGRRYRAFTSRHCGYEQDGCNSTRFPCRQPWITPCAPRTSTRSNLEWPPLP